MSKAKRDSGYSGQRMLNMKLPGRKKKGIPQRFMDAVKKDMQSIGVIEEDARVGLTQMSHCGDP